jgi:Ca2+/Na+ antiporter
MNQLKSRRIEMKKIVFAMVLIFFILQSFADSSDKSSYYFMIGEGVIGCAVLGGATSLYS